MPFWLRSPEQGFVRLFCFLGDVPVCEPGKAFHCGFLDLDSFLHDSGSVRPLLSHRGLRSLAWDVPNEVYPFHSPIPSDPPFPGSSPFPSPAPHADLYIHIDLPFAWYS